MSSLELFVECGGLLQVGDDRTAEQLYPPSTPLVDYSPFLLFGLSSSLKVRSKGGIDVGAQAL